MRSATARGAADAGDGDGRQHGGDHADRGDRRGRRGPLWFQLYPQPDLAFTAAVVRRAEAAGCRALVVTVDSPVFGRRERDLRNGFLDLPAGLRLREHARRDRPGAGHRDGRPELGWDRIDWLRGITGLPIVLKGVLHPRRRGLAVEHGVAGVLVSNHGGPQLDGAPATVDALPAVVAAVDGRVPVLLDGGIRRGTDVLAALALGATAASWIGRPVLWGLAADGGEPGSRRCSTCCARSSAGRWRCAAATARALTGDRYPRVTADRPSRPYAPWSSASSFFSPALPPLSVLAASRRCWCSPPTRRGTPAGRVWADATSKPRAEPDRTGPRPPLSPPPPSPHY